MDKGKTFTDFMIMYKKDSLSKEVNKLESLFRNTSSNISSVIQDEEFNDICESISENLSDIKKILVKYGLYSIT